jgi:hypothetical protein
MIVFKEKLKELKNHQHTEVFIPEPGSIYHLKENKIWEKSTETNHISAQYFGGEWEEL